MKILGEDINFEIENKKRAVLCFAVMALCIGFTAVNIAGKASKALSPTQPKAQQNAAAQNKANMAQNVVADKSDNLIIENSVISPDALLQKNPFMELKDAEPLEGSTIDEKRKESERAAEAREARKQVTFGPTGSIPLPNVPSAGLPLSMDVPPTLDASQNQPQPQQPQGPQETVKGIMTDASGASVAIMQGGQVVGLGDTYEGSVVTEVSGNGVVLENGTNIPFK